MLSMYTFKVIKLQCTPTWGQPSVMFDVAVPYLKPFQSFNTVYSNTKICCSQAVYSNIPEVLVPHDRIELPSQDYKTSVLPLY